MRWTIGFLAVVTVILLSIVSPVSGGECCRGHRSLYTYHAQRWCPVYCCGSASEGFYCCSDLTKRAFEGHIEPFCPAWFSNSANTWVIIVVSLILLALIIASIVCCIRCCCFVF